MQTYCACTFCDEFSGRSHSLFDCLAEQSGFLYASRIVAESSNFVALPGLGPMTEGYLLILPRNHIMSFGALPSCYHAEFRDFKASIWRKMMECYGDVIAFEHGPASPALKAGCCVDHAHLHLMAPCTVRLERLIEPFFDLVQIHGLEDLQQIHRQGLPYIFIETQSQVQYVAIAPSQLPSQFIRRLLGSTLKVNDWDWRMFPKMDRVKLICEIMSSGQDYGMK